MARGVSRYEVSPENGEVELYLRTEPVALATCANGHKSLLKLSDPAFALLYERALQRIVTGNPRDAVTDAYTALEMYLSHVPVRARYDRDSQLSPTVLRRTFKSVTKLSERALGAALAVSSVVSGQEPPRLNTEKTTTLRNRAVHAGHHPTEAEALCLEVERFVLELEARLDAAIAPRKTTYWSKVIQEEVVAIVEERGWTDLYPTSAHLGTVLGTARTNQTPVETARERIADYRQGIADGVPYWRVW